LSEGDLTGSAVVDDMPTVCAVDDELHVSEKRGDKKRRISARARASLSL
jgi:hypothetical protein